MKVQKVILIISLAILSWACDEERITFSEPQPKGVKADKKVRSEFVGNYFCEEDSTYLSITSSQIAESQFNKKNANEEGETKANIKAEFGSDSTSSFKVRFTKKGKDDIGVDAEVTETHLDLTKGHVAKYFKGYYFLNAPTEEGGGYRVRLIRKTHNGVIIGMISSDSLIHQLEKEEFVKKQIVQDDEEKWMLSPNRRQLKMLIQKGLFTDVKEYKQIGQEEK